VSLTKVVKDFT